MTRAVITPRDRMVVVGCAAVAGVAVVVPAVLWEIGLYPDTGDINLDLWLRAGIGLVPECAALAAVVLTRVRWVGVGIAVAAAVIGSFLGLVFFTLDGFSPGVGELGSWFGWEIVLALPLVAADLLAQWVRGFTRGTGAAAGALVGVVTAVVAFLHLVLRTGIDGLDLFPKLIWITEYAAPLVALALVGAVAGAVAQRTARYVPPDFARAPEPNPQWGSGPGSSPAG